MRIQLETAIVGPGVAYAAGDVVDWPNEAEAQRMIDRQMAVPFAGDSASQAQSTSKTERAKPQTATRRRPRTAGR